MKKSYNDDGCNLIKHLQIQKQLQLHQKRISNSKPTLRFRQTGNFCKQNQPIQHIKKQPLAEFNRIVSINIQNKALLDKLTHQPPSKIGKEKPYKLIKNNRKKNFQEYNQRIENEGLSKRIKQAKSSYKMQKFVTERKLTQKYVNSICKYGYKGHRPNKTIILPKTNHSRKIQSECQNRKYHTNDLITDQKQQTKNDGELYTHIPFIYEMIQQRRLKLQTKKITAKIKGVIWSHKITLQIDSSDGSSFVIELPHKRYVDQFGQNLTKLIKSVKYNQNQLYFYIQAPNME